MARVPQSGKKTFRVSEVITDHGTSLGKLLRRANSLMQIERLISGCLDPDLANQFQVATVRKNRLILISPSASWATMLRLQAPQLIRALQRAGLSEIEHIDIRVAPLAEQAASTRKRKALSPAARQALDLLAHFEDDEDDPSGPDGSSDLTDGG